MIWLVLLNACFNHQRVFVDTKNRSYVWSGIVSWVTPWSVKLKVSYDDNDSAHSVILPINQIECVRNFIPSAARQIVEDAYRDDPPFNQGVHI